MVPVGLFCVPSMQFCCVTTRLLDVHEGSSSILTSFEFMDGKYARRMSTRITDGNSRYVCALIRIPFVPVSPERKF